MVDRADIEDLYRLVRHSMELVQAFATESHGEAWRMQARAHFPGDGEQTGLLEKRTFLPWALFRWRPRIHAGGMSDGGGRADFAGLFIRHKGAAVEREVTDFLRAARKAPFRFLVATGDENAHPTFLDSLSTRELTVAWPADWPRVPAQGAIFAQVVELGDLAVFTHEPVPMDLCNAPVEQLLAFFRRLILAVEAFRQGTEEAEIIAENMLFRQAAAHMQENGPGTCRDAAGADSARIHELQFEWPADEPEPEMEGLPRHASWVRMQLEGDVLKVQAPGFLPTFAVFRHMILLLPRIPRLRGMALKPE